MLLKYCNLLYIQNNIKAVNFTDKKIMKELFKKNRGFTLLEISIALTISLMLSGSIFLNVGTIATKGQAKECSRNLLMLHQAVNNYCLDNNISYGTTVHLSDLEDEGYLDSDESYECPKHRTPYQTTFTYGVMPTCPDELAGHECSTE